MASLSKEWLWITRNIPNSGLRSFASIARQPVRLADDMQEDVAKELHGAVLAAFQQIVSKLNARGHNLTTYGEIEVGDIPYRDEPDGETLLPAFGL